MDFPKGGLIGRCAALWRRIKGMNIPAHAANTGFFLVLSVFPALVLTLSILRYTDLDAADLMDLISAYIPRALYEPVQKLVIQTYAYSGAAMVSVSAVSALWSSSRGMYGILQGLNAVYDAKEDRGWLYTRLVSVAYTFAFLAVLLLSLIANVFGGWILTLLPGQSVIARLVSSRYLLLLILQTGLFAAMFTVLPNRPNRFRDSIPGAVLASVGWLVFSELFSWYVEHGGGYSNIYGSVYALALGMLWLYCCMSIFFYGAALNRLLEE